MSPAQSAAKEAYEEAGVIGAVIEDLVGSYQYRKLNKDHHVDTYLLQVEETLNNWPERISRKRAWLPQKKAWQRVKDNGISALLKSINVDRCPPVKASKKSPERVWQAGQASLCFDFDDTLCQHDGQPFPGARDFAHECHDAGYRLSLSSARFGPLYGGLNEGRMAKVGAWLKEHGFPEIPISYAVPAADLYIDDKAWAFQDPWPESVSQLKTHFGIRPYKQANKTLSISLTGSILDEENRPLSEVGEQLHQLAKIGMKIKICLGLFDPDSPEDRRVAKAVDWLRARHLPYHQVSPAKLASDLYISPNALRFRGQWAEQKDEVHKILREKRI